MSSFLAKWRKPIEPLPLPGLSKPAAPTPPPSRFPACLACTLEFEGGYVFNARDPGGATNRGITRATLAEWRKNPEVTPEDVKDLSEEETAAIYRARYWHLIRGDDLPPGVDLVVFDAAVHSGPQRAIMWLQGAIGVEKDGKLGPVTIMAAQAAKASIAIAEICDRRLDFLKKLQTWPLFGNGWSQRLKQVREIALEMATETPVPG